MSWSNVVQSALHFFSFSKSKTIEQSNQQAQDYFGTIPNSILLIIFHKIPFNDIFNYRMVCRRWYKVINSADSRFSLPIALTLHLLKAIENPVHRVDRHAVIPKEKILFGGFIQKNTEAKLIVLIPGKSPKATFSIKMCFDPSESWLQLGLKAIVYQDIYLPIDHLEIEMDKEKLCKEDRRALKTAIEKTNRVLSVCVSYAIESPHAVYGYKRLEECCTALAVIAIPSNPEILRKKN